MKKSKQKIKIKINKKYKEKMYYKLNSNGEQSSSSTNEPENENFKWVNENDDFLNNKYIQFPFNLWKEIIEKNNELNNKIIDEGKMYQKVVCDILEIDIFKNENFVREKTEYNVFLEFLKNSKFNLSNLEISKLNNSSPDFFIKEIKKQKFLEIMNNRKYMIVYDDMHNNLNNILYIYLVGEIKINPRRVKDKKNQKKTYLDICNNLNKNNKNIYFFTFYIFDVDYKKFWEKKIFKKKPIIIAYVPKLYKTDYLDAYKIVSKNVIKKRQEKIMINNNEENNDNKIINQNHNEVIMIDNIENTEENRSIEKNKENPKEIMAKESQEIFEDINLDQILEVKTDLNNDNNVIDRTNFLLLFNKLTREYEDDLIRQSRNKENEKLKNEIKDLKRKRKEYDLEIKSKRKSEDNKIKYIREFEDILIGKLRAFEDEKIGNEKWLEEDEIKNKSEIESIQANEYKDSKNKRIIEDTYKNYKRQHEDDDLKAQREYEDNILKIKRESEDKDLKRKIEHIKLKREIENLNLKIKRMEEDNLIKIELNNDSNNLTQKKRERNNN